MKSPNDTSTSIKPYTTTTVLSPVPKKHQHVSPKKDAFFAATNPRSSTKPSLFRKKPPPQSVNIDALNYESMRRRENKPLYTQSTTTVTTKTHLTTSIPSTNIPTKERSTTLMASLSSTLSDREDESDQSGFGGSYDDVNWSEVERSFRQDEEDELRKHAQELENDHGSQDNQPVEDRKTLLKKQSVYMLENSEKNGQLSSDAFSNNDKDHKGQKHDPSKAQETVKKEISTKEHVDCESLKKDRVKHDPISKDSINKFQNHDRKRENNREQERKMMKDQSRKIIGKETASHSKSSMDMCRRDSITFSDIESDSNDELMQNKQPPQSTKSEMPLKYKQLSEEQKRRSSADEKSFISSQPIYQAKHANLHRSHDDQDSESELGDPFAVPLTQSQTRNDSSPQPKSRPFKKPPSEASMDSGSSLAVNVASSKSSRDTADGISDDDFDDSPFLDSKRKSYSSTTVNNKETLGTFVLKTRKNIPQSPASSHAQKDQQHRSLELGDSRGACKHDFKKTNLESKQMSNLQTRSPHQRRLDKMGEKNELGHSNTTTKGNQTQSSTIRQKKEKPDQPNRTTTKLDQAEYDPLAVLLTPSKVQRKTNMADQIYTSKKRQSYPISTSDEDSDSTLSRSSTPEPSNKATNVINMQNESPATPAKMKSELDDVKRKGLESPRKSPRVGDEFKLPSPRRKRIRTIAEMMSLSDEEYSSSSDATQEGRSLCPYCGDVLPREMSSRLKSSYAKILAKLEDRRLAQQELLRREQLQNEYLENDMSPIPTQFNSTAQPVLPITATTQKKPPAPRPKRLERHLKPTPISSYQTAEANNQGNNDVEEDDELEQRLNGRMSVVDMYEFCRIHESEEIIVPAGLEKNYPLFIPFDELPDRIRRLESELLNIIHGTIASPYREKALANYRKLGYGARSAQAGLAGVRQVQPGYYGSKGMTIMTDVLTKMFIQTNILTHDYSKPQLPVEFVQNVLVPETGLRLIQEDRNIYSNSQTGLISIEEAREIMMDSVEFGNYVHDADLPCVCVQMC
ncbi:hypothetical protein FBU30_008679 [Linnemannia zychae]|nr:hypothetical protein FBU30_008679 [Linnemannia zychae]